MVRLTCITVARRIGFPLLLLVAELGLVQPCMTSLISRTASGDDQGATLGLGQSLASLARATGPVLGGYLFQRMGIHAPYLVAGALFLASGLIGLGLRDPQSPSSPG